MEAVRQLKSVDCSTFINHSRLFLHLNKEECEFYHYSGSVCSNNNSFSTDLSNIQNRRLLAVRKLRALNTISSNVCPRALCCIQRRPLNKAHLEAQILNIGYSCLFY